MDNILLFILKENTTQKHLKKDLLHYSYYTIEEHRLQADKFAKIASIAYHEAGKKSSAFKIVFSLHWLSCPFSASREICELS